MRKLKLTAITTMLACVLVGQAVMAEGTGDSTLDTKDKPTKAQSKVLSEKLKLAQEHSEKMKKKQSSSGDFTTQAYGESKTISVPSFKQETSYWCGVATTKQIIDFFNGSSSTQSYYAGKLGTTTDGTDFSVVDDVLNAHQSENTYTYRSFSSNEYLTWRSSMILSIDWGTPVALDLKISPTYMPLYNSSVAGHILNTSGYDATDENNMRLRLTDPYDQGGRGVTLGNVWHPLDGVWQANQAHFRKAIIW